MIAGGGRLVGLASQAVVLSVEAEFPAAGSGCPSMSLVLHGVWMHVSHCSQFTDHCLCTYASSWASHSRIFSRFCSFRGFGRLKIRMGFESSCD